jgi:hypothetical protein
MSLLSPLEFQKSSGHPDFKKSTESAAWLFDFPPNTMAGAQDNCSARIQTA